MDTRRAAFAGDPLVGAGRHLNRRIDGDGPEVVGIGRGQLPVPRHDDVGTRPVVGVVAPLAAVVANAEARGNLLELGIVAEEQVLQVGAAHLNLLQILNVERVSRLLLLLDGSGRLLFGFGQQHCQTQGGVGRLHREHVLRMSRIVDGDTGAHGLQFLEEVVAFALEASRERERCGRREGDKVEFAHGLFCLVSR